MQDQNYNIHSQFLISPTLNVTVQNVEPKYSNQCLKGELKFIGTCHMKHVIWLVQADKQ